MSYLDRVHRCNRRDMGRYGPVMAGAAQAGWVTAERKAALLGFADVFAPHENGIAFAAQLTTAKARSEAVAEIAPQLIASGLFPKLRREMYAIKNRWSEPELLRLDRGLVAGFGARAYGVHLNGFVRKAPTRGASGLHLWIGTRAMDCKVEPGKLDNLVAGGQPADLSLTDNLVKECGEEAHMDAALARAARAVGVITYAFDGPEELKADTLFCYDLETPADFTPRPSEEITAFTLMPVEEVLALVRDGEQFKFNVNLVVLDFAMRHGVLNPESEPAFEAIVAGLHEYPQPIARNP